MTKRIGFLTVVFAVCVTWFSVTQMDTTVMSRTPGQCEVNHQVFGYTQKYRYTPDSMAYLYLSGGTVPFHMMTPPYKYRVLTPMLTAVTTLAIPGVSESMEAVTLVSLWAFYTVTAWTLLSIGVGVWPILLGFVGTLSFWHVYLYQNPWSADGVHLFFAAVLILCAVKKKWVPFVVTLIVGMMNKEAILFLAPLWFFVDDKAWKKWGALLAGVFMYLLPRVQDTEAMGWYLKKYGGATMAHNLDHFPTALLTILWAWGLMWVIGMLGAARHKVVGSAFWLLTAGALVSCVSAADHGRMMASISPAMFPAISLFFGGKK